MAVEAPITETAAFMQPDLFTSAVKTFSVLFILLALILVALYLVKRFWPGGAGLSGSNQWLKVIATAPLAPKKMISLVEIAGEVVVLGLTEHHITMLTKVAHEDVIHRIKNYQGKGIHNSPFYEQLKSLITGQRPSGDAGEDLLRSSAAIPTVPEMSQGPITVPGADS